MQVFIACDAGEKIKLHLPKLYFIQYLVISPFLQQSQGLPLICDHYNPLVVLASLPVSVIEMPSRPPPPNLEVIEVT